MQYSKYPLLPRFSLAMVSNVSRETLQTTAIRYNASMTKPIKSFTIDELQDLMKDLKQPAFRKKQLIEWLYLHHVDKYDDMTNLPSSLRDSLAREHPLHVPTIADMQTSIDGTKKFVLSFYDGACVETVAIPSNDGRLTVCCSTQAGCPMGCAFCATGKEGFTRNLSVGEIVDQIFIVQDHMEKRVSNIVVMGQGEPFLNYDHTLSALRTLNDEKLLNIGARHITISTCGIIPGIDRLGNEPEQFTLAVSLHAALQHTRDTIMPGVSKYPLTNLKAALLKYVEHTNRRITLEYAMIQGINDSAADLEALVDFCTELLCHVNLIPLNEIEGSEFQPSSSKTMGYWHMMLNKHGIETTVRNSRGSDIAGACGQLKNALKTR